MSERSPSAAKERAGVQSRDTSLALPDAFDAWCAETGGGTDLDAFRAGFGYGHDRGWGERARVGAAQRRGDGAD